jgi:hypothetical protein
LILGSKGRSIDENGIKKMARYATAEPQLTLPASITFKKKAIDSLLHEYDEKVKTFELESGRKSGARCYS